ncbi:MAG: 2-isopropylmalate synthase [Treponema sp.]|jgi:2-isopropylmalate synthase|nr:2-isopropylmalate synthase [Treponema sp.]
MDYGKIIHIFDTTLRDGEQAPGCSMNLTEKIAVARQLERLGVDVIEAGFPASSPGDLTAVKAIAQLIKDATVAALCRALKTDIDKAWEALASAVRPRIHIFLATSPIHLRYKLHISPEQMLEQAVAAVSYAKQYCEEVEFSAEDATRSDLDFVAAVFSAVIKAGARIVNIPDTVGYALPQEFAALVSAIKERTENIEHVQLSVHCHNDLGLAVANSLAAIEAGATQVECTINGLGERAGNASLEEIVMGLRVRHNFLHADTAICTEQLYVSSKLVSQVTGVKVQPNKAIVGDNAFLHEAGIHQHGVLANRETYEIMKPESIGIPQQRFVLGKHSGRHAFETHLQSLGMPVDPALLDKIFLQFKELADRKKEVTDSDVTALVMGISGTVSEVTWKLDRWVVNSGSSLSATSAIRLQHKDGRLIEKVSVGDGPIDAAFKSINQIIEKEPVLELYELSAITSGEDAQGQTMVKIAWNKRCWNGRGVSTDIVESSIKAYLAAINALEWEFGSTAD